MLLIKEPLAATTSKENLSGAKFSRKSGRELDETSCNLAVLLTKKPIRKITANNCRFLRNYFRTSRQNLNEGTSFNPS